jgi:hypothetical protein
MPVLEPDELGALERAEAPRRLEPRDPGERVGEAGGHDQGLAAASSATYFSLGFTATARFAGQCPRRRGPDDDRRARRGRRPGSGVTSGNFT